MAIDLVGPGITAGVSLATGAVVWFARSISTRKDVEALDKARDKHEERLDGHDEEIKQIKSDFVPRAEVNEKLELYFNPLQRQMDQQTRLLEFAIMGKTPEHPLIHEKKD